MHELFVYSADIEPFFVKPGNEIFYCFVIFTGDVENICWTTNVAPLLAEMLGELVGQDFLIEDLPIW